MDFEIFKSLWRWAKRRHSKKSKHWIKDKYFLQLKGRKWCFAAIEKRSKSTRTKLCDSKGSETFPLKTTSVLEGKRILMTLPMQITTNAAEIKKRKKNSVREIICCVVCGCIRRCAALYVDKSLILKAVGVQLSYMSTADSSSNLYTSVARQSSTQKL
ncbi:MAG: hypothetical protein ACLR8Y_16230 [Alistipes indistinctus]